MPPIALNFADFGHPRGQRQGARPTQHIAAARERVVRALRPRRRRRAAGRGRRAHPEPAASRPPARSTADSLATLAPGEITFDSAPAKTIGTSGTLYGNEFGEPSRKLVPDGRPATAPPAPSTSSAPAPAEGYTLLGSPTVVARIDAPGANTQIAARLMDIASTGEQKLVARGLWRPEIGGPSRQVFQLNPNGWEFKEGHVAKLELLPDDAPYGRASPGQGEVTVSNLELRLPVVESPGDLGGLVAEPAPKILSAEMQLAPGFDAGPPATRMLDRPARFSRDATPRFDFLSSDTGSTYRCRLDSSGKRDWSGCDRPFEPGASPRAGTGSRCGRSTRIRTATRPRLRSCSDSTGPTPRPRFGSARSGRSSPSPRVRTRRAPPSSASHAGGRAPLPGQEEVRASA